MRQGASFHDVFSSERDLECLPVFSSRSGKAQIDRWKKYFLLQFAQALFQKAALRVLLDQGQGLLIRRCGLSRFT